MVALVPFAVSFVVPLVTENPYAFANRGLIWAGSLQAWSEQPFVGLGSNWYSQVGSTTGRLASSAFEGHNQFVHMLVTGGIVVLVLVVLMIVAASVRAGRMAASGEIFGVVYLATLGTAWSLEASFYPVGDTTSMFAVVVVPLAFLMFGRYGLDGVGQLRGVGRFGAGRT